MPHLLHRLHQLTPRKINPSLLMALCVAIAWWLLTRPYQGIWHDGLLYTAQALKHLYPERYGHDIFFLFGSQDDFTIFSFFHSWLIDLLGIDHAFLLLTVIGGAIWLYALLVLLRRWLSGIPLIATLILVLSSDAHYAGFDLFLYGEGFATPRVFAEGLVLLSIPLWLDRERLKAVFIVAAAALLHPLIALAGIGIMCWSALCHYVKRPILFWWVVFGAGLLGLQLLVWSGISPYLDPLWRQLVELRSPFIFPHLWNLTNWLRLALDAMLLWMATRYVREEPGRLAGVVLPVLVLAILWALAAGVMGVQLAVAAQLPRVQWLAHLLALALTVPLCLHLWRSGGPYDRYLAVGVASSLIFPLNFGGGVLPVAYGLYRWAGYRLGGRPIPRGLHLLLLITVPLMGVALWLFQFGSKLVMAQMSGNNPVWLIVMKQAPVAMGLSLGLYVALKRLKWEQAGLWLYGLSLLAVGILNWDVRKPWGIYEQAARSEAIAPVKEIIPEHAVVYWEKGVFVNPDGGMQFGGGVAETWLWLNRAHYASHIQAAGNVFYRQTALEISRRIAHIRRWGFQGETLDWMKRNKIPKIHSLTEAQLTGVCSDPILDFVIADTKLPAERLSFRDPLTDRKFSVYDCRAMRAG